uniref:ribosomal protein S4 n=1 Tax=Cephaleuros karstenii TaxID=1985640 RepID=UPI001EDEE671|nr:ribosomal protein S4 [Cephaleuros karstenii]UIB39122.1 ribosomal protein S4 [Cephaleuros karstenii]
MRYTGPKLKILRRLNLKNLPGLTQKSLKNFKESSKKQSLYSIRLMEKQKLRFNYGLTNNQFLNYVKRAQKTSGSTGENLIKFLESRFDNIVFRLKLAPTINAARQLITHGHFEINKKKVTIPSYECSINECEFLK